MGANWKWRPYRRVFPSHLDAGVDDELRFHLSERVEALMAEGLSEDAARAQALAEFGDVHDVRRTLVAVDAGIERRRRRTEWIVSVWSDVRYAARTLRRAPRFTLAALTTLGLGVGLASMVIGAADAVLLRPLPYHEPERLVSLHEITRADSAYYSVAFASLRDLERQGRAFAGLAGSSLRARNLTGRGQPQRVWSDIVSPNFFDVLGVRPFLGRAFRRDENTAGRNRVAVISYGLWEQLGSDPDLLGSVVRIDDLPHEIVGVAPLGFQPPDEFGRREPVALYTPLSIDDDSFAPDNHGDHELNAIARLAPRITVAQAQADVDRVWAWLAKTYPDSNRDLTAHIRPLGADLVHEVREPMLVLVGAVALLWLVASVNLATLMLVQFIGRQREIAVRTALGASRPRVLQMLVVQGAVVALAGSAIGLAFGMALIKVFSRLVPTDVPRAVEMSIDWQVAAAVIVLSIVAGIAVGLVPAWRVSRAAVSDTLRSAERRMVSASAVRWRSILVTSEIALSLILLTGCALLLKSFVTLVGVDLGFLTDRVLTMRIELPGSRYPTADDRLRFFEQLASRVGALPDVQAVAFANRFPLRGGWGGGMYLADQRERMIEVDLQAVSAGYFATLGIPVLRGRGLETSDRTGSLPVAVVNAAFAAKYFPDRDAVGRHLLRNEQEPSITIVGVVGDVRRAGKAEPVAPGVYLPAAQTALYPVRLADFAIRSSHDPHALVPSIQAAVLTIDRELPIGNVRTLSEVVGDSLALRRLQVGLISVFAALALVLTVVGVYGVAACAAAQRTVEFGVRVALGATPSDILRLVLTQSAALIAGGLVVGIAGALAFARWMESLLFEVRPHDPATLAAVSLLLVAVAMVASYVPARRAARIDPADALRAE